MDWTVTGMDWKHPHNGILARWKLMMPGQFHVGVDEGLSFQNTNSEDNDQVGKTMTVAQKNTKADMVVGAWMLKKLEEEEATRDSRNVKRKIQDCTHSNADFSNIGSKRLNTLSSCRLKWWQAVGEDSFRLIMDFVGEICIFSGEQVQEYAALFPFLRIKLVGKISEFYALDNVRAMSMEKVNNIQSFALNGCRLATNDNREWFINQVCGRQIKELDFQGCKLRAIGGEALIAELYRVNCPSLTKLNLSHNHLGYGALELLGCLLQKNRTLEQLDLGFNDRIFLDPITEGLRNNTTLKVLNLETNQLGYCEASFASFMQVLAVTNNTLRVLSLQGNFLTSICGFAIGQMIRQNRSITHLNISSNVAIGNVAAQSILQALTINQTLVQLNASFIGLRTMGTFPLQQIALKELGLIGNSIIGNMLLRDPAQQRLELHPCFNGLTCLSMELKTPCQAVVLGKLIKGSKTLTDLAIPYSTLNQAAWTELLSVITINKTIKTLNLAKCILGSPEVRAVFIVAHCLQHNRTLESIDLTENAIDLLGCCQLYHALRENTTLRTLKLGANFFGCEGGLMIADLLHNHNFTIRKLDLTLTCLSERVARRISFALKQRTVVHRVCLGLPTFEIFENAHDEDDEGSSSNSSTTKNVSSNSNDGVATTSKKTGSSTYSKQAHNQPNNSNPVVGGPGNNSSLIILPPKPEGWLQNLPRTDVTMMNFVERRRQRSADDINVIACYENEESVASSFMLTQQRQDVAGEYGSPIELDWPSSANPFWQIQDNAAHLICGFTGPIAVELDKVLEYVPLLPYLQIQLLPAGGGNTASSKAYWHRLIQAVAQFSSNVEVDFSKFQFASRDDYAYVSSFLQIPTLARKVVLNNCCFETVDFLAHKFSVLMPKTGVSAALQSLRLSNCHLNDQRIHLLLSSLYSNGAHRALKELCLHDNEIQEMGAATIAKICRDKSCILEQIDLSECELDDGDVCTIIDSLIHSNHLKSLNLALNRITLRAVRELCKVIVTTPISVLDLSATDLEEASFCSLGKLFNRYPDKVVLQTLYLNGNEANDAGVEAIFRGIGKKSSLRKLYLGSNLATSSIGRATKRMLSVNTTLEELDLSDNDLLCEATTKLAEGLAVNRALKTLNISNTNIGPSGATALGNSLKRNETLRALDLSGNYVEDLGGISIVRGLRCNKGLRELNLSCNNLGNNTGYLLARSLGHANSTLENLDISDNYLHGDDLFMELAENLARNTVLTELNISATNIGCSGARILANKIFAQNHTLKSLKMKRANIESDGLAHICSALVKQGDESRLEALELSGNVFHHFVQPLGDLLRQTKSLKSLGLNYCVLSTEFVCSFANSIVKTCPLEELGLTDNCFGSEAGLKLREVLSQNPQSKLRVVSILKRGSANLSQCLYNFPKFNEYMEKLDDLENIHYSYTQ